MTQIKPARGAAERLIWRALLIAMVLVMVTVLLPKILDLFSPFVIALAVIALMQPLLRFAQTKLHMKRKYASVILIVLVIALVFFLLYWCCSFVAVQFINVTENAQSIISGVIDVLQTAADKLLSLANTTSDGFGSTIRASLNDAFNTLSSAGMRLAGEMVNATVALATGLPYAFIYANFLVMALIFINNRFEPINAFFHKKRANIGSGLGVLRKSAGKGVMGYIRVQLLFSLLCCLLSWVFFQAVGFEYAFLIAFVAALLEMIPQFGCGTLYIPWSIICFIVGQTHNGWLVMGLYLGFCIIRRVTEPALLGTNLGVSPLVSLMGMFVGMRTGGVIGLILGPIVMVVLVSAVRAHLFDNTVRDIKIIIMFFKERWKVEEVKPNGG